MAITQTGSIVENGTTGASTNSGSNTITVPADAEIMLVGVSGYDAATTAYMTGGSLTIGGAAMTAITGGDASTSFWGCALFYKVLPATGSQTLAWDWKGANAPDSGFANISSTFWKGINTGGGASTIRSSDGKQTSGTGYTSNTLTASSGDKIVSYVAINNGSDTTFTWSGTNVSELGEITFLGIADGGWGSADPTGNQTITATCAVSTDGGICSVVLIAAGGGGETITMDKWSNHSAELIAKRPWGVVASGTIGIKN